MVVAGNVATPREHDGLIDAGADRFKSESVRARSVLRGSSPVRVPQVQRGAGCNEEAEKRDIPVIADGGIKYSGDITKAIAAGANTVMIGNLFAGLKESPGKEIIFEGRIFKQYRGMGSLGAIRDGSGDRYQLSKDEEPVPEGIEGRVPYKGEAQTVHPPARGGVEKRYGILAAGGDDR